LDYHAIKIKNSELKDLQVLVDNFKLMSKNISLFDKYFIGYTIPQIGKEFDLLRIDKDTIVNIEIKRQSTVDRILAQLQRNTYYLSFLKKDVQCYTFVASENKLYFLSKRNVLLEVNFSQLLRILVSQDVKRIDNIDSYFNPSNYLISPFNSTQEFIKRKYFLTLQQDEIKANILNLLV